MKRVYVPAGTCVFGTGLTPFHAISGTWCVLLSTGRNICFAPATVPWQWDVLGVLGSEEISWAGFRFEGTCLGLDGTSCLRHEYLGGALSLKTELPAYRVTPSGNGMLPVAVFGRATRAQDPVDGARLRLGVTGQAALPRSHSFVNVNADGGADLFVNFRIPETGMAAAPAN